MLSGALGRRRLVGLRSLKFQQDPFQFIGRGKHSPREDKLDRVARVSVGSVEQARQRKKPAEPHGWPPVLTLGYQIDSLGLRGYHALGKRKKNPGVWKLCQFTQRSRMNIRTAAPA
jgi:hypothetical protein